MISVTRKKKWTHEIPTEISGGPRNAHGKKIKLTKYPREKIWIHEIPMGKNFGSMKYSQKEIFDRRNTQVRKFRTHEIPQEKFWTQWKYRKKLFIISKAIDFYKKRCKRFAIIWWNCWLFKGLLSLCLQISLKKNRKARARLLL